MKIVKTRAFKDRLKGHKETIIVLHSPYGAAGGLLLSASKDGLIRAWDLVQREITCKLLISRWPNETTINEQQQQEEDKQLQQKKPIKDQLCAATFTDKNVYGGYEDGYIGSWNLKTEQLLNKYEGHTGPITSLMFQNARVLCSASQDGTIRMWDTNTGDCEAVIKFGHPISKMRIGAQNIEVLYNNDTFALINNNTLNLTTTAKFPDFSITSFLFTADSLIFGTVENNIYVYSMSDIMLLGNQDPDAPQLSINPKHLIEGIQGWALCMEVLEKHIFIGTDDKKIRVYELSTWKMVEEFIGHEDGVTSIAFADNMLYSGAFDHSIRSWDLKEMYNRIRERRIMFREDINSRRYEVYLKALPKKKKGKGKAAATSKKR